MTNRRDFLALSATTALYLLTGCGDSSNAGSESGGGNILPIPALMTPTIQSGVAHYNLDLIETQHTFFSGIQTSAWSWNACSWKYGWVSTSADSSRYYMVIKIYC